MNAAETAGRGETRYSKDDIAGDFVPRDRPLYTSRSVDLLCSRQIDDLLCSRQIDGPTDVATRPVLALAGLQHDHFDIRCREQKGHRGRRRPGSY